MNYDVSQPRTEGLGREGKEEKLQQSALVDSGSSYQNPRCLFADV